MFYPTGLRKYLRELSLSDRVDVAKRVNDHGARTGCSLVDCEHKTSGGQKIILDEVRLGKVIANFKSL